MGEHDQTVLHGDDAHGNIHDDGRTLRPAGLYDPEVAAEDDGHNNIHFRDEVMPGPRLRMTPVFRYSHDELIPDILHVHLRPFSATEWESLYSTPFGTGTEPQLYHYPMWDATDPSFTPVIDESYRVVGHLGWISGEQICVPMFTVAAHSPSALVLEKARLGEIGSGFCRCMIETHSPLFLLVARVLSRIQGFGPMSAAGGTKMGRRKRDTRKTSIFFWQQAGRHSSVARLPWTCGTVSDMKCIGLKAIDAWLL